jgi:hypothetical protein
MDTAVRAGTEEKTDTDWIELCAKGTPEEVLKALENERFKNTDVFRELLRAIRVTIQR